MLKYKTIIRLCLVEYFLSLLTFIVFGFMAMDVYSAVNICIFCFVMFLAPCILCHVKPLTRVLPYIIGLFFISAVSALSVFTSLLLFLPFAYASGAITIAFFLDPKLTVCYSAAAMISLLTLIFIQPDDVYHTLPIPVFVILMFALLIMFVTTTVLTYLFRKSIVRSKKFMKSASRHDQRKNFFWESASFEIRTQINVVNSMCQTLLRDDVTEQTRRECAYGIQSAGKDLLLTLNDASDYTMLENRRVKIAEEPYIFTSVLNDLVNLCSTKMNGDKVDFIVDCEPDIPYEMYGDCARIKQVVMSIFSNSAKFTESGSITMRISCRKTQYGVNLRFNVTDTGCGISPQVIDKIFTVYSNVAKNDSERYSTHLGLGVSHELVTLMGGFIYASGNVSGGTSMTVTIPQKVKTSNPFIKISDSGSICALIYVERPQLRGVYEKALAALGVDTVFCAGRTDFMLKKDNLAVTHIFTDYGLFTFDRPIFDILSQKTVIIVPKSIDSIEETELPTYVKRVFYPLYIGTFASIFNNEYVPQASDGYEASFSAPKATVLIVDDSPVNLKVAKSFMQPYNMNIFCAENGDAALELITKNHFDIVFMDHLMPHPDGIETTKNIRALNGGYFEKLPIVALTANAVSGMKTVFLENGFSDFISKPIELRAIDTVLRRWLPDELIDNAELKPITKTVISKFYDGLNVLNGIRNVGGNAGVYCDILETFCGEYTRIRSTIETALRECDYDRYIMEVHGLKGSSMNIGALALSEFARQLETAARQNETVLITERTPTLFVIYNQVLDSISEYLSDNGKELKEEVDMKNSVEMITTELQARNAATSEQLLKHLLDAQLSSAQRKLAENALEAVMNFEFSDACETIARLSEK